LIMGQIEFLGLILLALLGSGHGFEVIDTQMKSKGFLVGVNPQHYGDPAGGCMGDEIQVRSKNKTVACMPKCNINSCPKDSPPGTSAIPLCIIRDSRTGDSLCGIVCSEYAQGSCPPTASCTQMVVNRLTVGICLYPKSDPH
jgi:hypothetical protein